MKLTGPKHTSGTLPSLNDRNILLLQETQK